MHAELQGGEVDRLSINDLGFPSSFARIVARNRPLIITGKRAPTWPGHWAPARGCLPHVVYSTAKREESGQ